jgi:cytochrome c oxidase subunit 2
MEKLIILIVLVTGVIALAQLVRVYELSSKLKKKGEHDVNDRDNHLNAKLMLGFMMFQFLGFIYLMLTYGWTGRGEAASLEGVETDWLLNLNFIIIIIVFFITNFLLFFFSYKYVRKPGVKATYYSHNNKLEAIWTVVPAIVLAVIIILGLQSWNDLTSGPTKKSVRIELFAKQFDWTARYSGENGKLGKYDYKLTNEGNNPLALKTTETIESAKVETEKAIKALEDELKLAQLDHLTSGYRGLISASAYKSHIEEAYNAALESDFNLVEVEQSYKHIYADVQGLKGHVDVVIQEPNAETQKIMDRLEEKLIVKGRILRSIVQMQQNYDSKYDDYAWDDIIQTDTLYLCKGTEYEFSFRSKDVIHSAYFPHFRAQMNVVPGMPTRFKFTPSLTTEEMRKKKSDSKFNFILMCNKICGTAHYKMKMIVVVLPGKEYQNWEKSKQQNTFKDTYSAGEESEAPANSEIKN